MATTELQIAGTGHVYTAPVDTAPFALEGYTFSLDPAAFPTGWTWIGDVASDDTVKFDTNGGDATYKDTWDRKSVRVIRASETVSATITSVNMSQETFNLGFSNHVYDAATKSYKVSTNAGSAQRAIMIVMYDSEGIAGMYLPNTDIKGSFPVFATDDFTKVALNVSVLGSPTQSVNGDPMGWQWFEPRPITVTP